MHNGVLREAFQCLPFLREAFQWRHRLKNPCWDLRSLSLYNLVKQERFGLRMFLQPKRLSQKISFCCTGCFRHVRNIKTYHMQDISREISGRIHNDTLYLYYNIIHIHNDIILQQSTCDLLYQEINRINISYMNLETLTWILHASIFDSHIMYLFILGKFKICCLQFL